MIYLTKEGITDYFKLLKEEFICNELMNALSGVYTMLTKLDYVCLDSHAPFVIALAGLKKVPYRISDNKNQATAIACVRASVQCILPFIMFDAKRLNLK